MKKNIIRGVLVAVITLGIITAGAFIQNGVRNLYGPKEVPSVPTPVYESVKCLTDSQSYNFFIESDGQIAKLIDGRKSMFASNGRLSN